jgi:hypothetical protein
MSALVDLLHGMSAKIDAQGAEIARMKAETAKGAGGFRPMDPTIQPVTGAQAAPQLHNPGEGMDEQRSLPHGVDSHELPDAALINFPRIFDAGDAVRIRRDARRDATIPKSWGEIMASAGNGQGQIRCNIRSRRFQRGCPGTVTVGEACPLCGVGPTVKKAEFLNPNGQWIYKVWVNGMTGPQGQAFEQRELVHADGRAY